MELNRGDIYLVNFNPAKGGEMGKLRPAVILSRKEENSIFNTVIVVPFSTMIVEDSQPYRYKITERDKLEKISDACIYEIRSLSQDRLKLKLGVLTQIELKEIQKLLCKIVT